MKIKILYRRLDKRLHKARTDKDTLNAIYDFCKEFDNTNLEALEENHNE